MCDSSKSSIRSNSNKLLWALLMLQIGAAHFAISQTFVPSGSVTGVWTAQSSPYIITGDIRVDVGQSLEIEPSTEVRFDGYYEFTVYGRLHAVGEINDSIFFMAHDNSGSTLLDSTGRWKGIRIEHDENLDSTKLIYCSITEVRGGLFNDLWYPFDTVQAASWGALNVYNSNKVEISESRIFNNCSYIDTINYVMTARPGSITLIQSSAIIRNCEIHDNIGMCGVGVFDESSPVITHNIIRDNLALNGAGMFVWWKADAYIEGNEISHNTAFGPNGGGMIISLCDASVENNIISFNEVKKNGGGIYLGGGNTTLNSNLVSNNSTLSGNCGPADGGGGIFITGHSVQDPMLARVYNNVIVNNSSQFGGGGLQLTTSNSIISNNTICNNECYGAPGGGVKSYEDQSLLVNNIIYGNSAIAGSCLAQLGSSDNIVYRNNNLGPAFGNYLYRSTAIPTPFDSLNIVFTDPNILSPSPGSGSQYDGVNVDWRLNVLSPLVDAGINDTTGLFLPSLDYFGNNRIHGDFIDIGAHEVGLLSLSGKETTEASVRIYPNPCVNHANLIADQPIKAIQVYNGEGRLLVDKSINNCIYTLNTHTYNNGVYQLIIELQSGENLILNLMVIQN